jgi:tRNA(Ser,Leu) C12 N-acetylase TAN1
VYNLIITAYRNEANYLLKELKPLGAFNKTPFRDVITGRVDDIKAFLDKISEQPPLSLARVIPLKEVLEFTDPDKLFKVLKQKVLDYAPQNKKSFRVTVERRGWKGEINSHEWEKKLGAIIHVETKSPVNLENPDYEVIIEVMKDSCGINVLTKDLKEKYFFVRT